jgi:hypothetical protein
MTKIKNKFGMKNDITDDQNHDDDNNDDDTKCNNLLFRRTTDVPINTQTRQN